MTFGDTKAALYNELLDGEGREKSDVYYDIAIFSALESITETGKRYISENSIDKEKLLERLKEILKKYKRINNEYDGFDTTDEWKNSLQSKDREILEKFDKLKQDKTGAWIPSNNRDKIYEIIKEKHPKLHNSWYFRDYGEERNNLEDKIDNICYMITIINEFNRMND